MAVGCKERAHLLRECLSNSMKVGWLPTEQAQVPLDGCLCSLSLGCMMSSHGEGAPFICCGSCKLMLQRLLACGLSKWLQPYSPGLPAGGRGSGRGVGQSQRQPIWRRAVSACIQAAWQQSSASCLITPSASTAGPAAASCGMISPSWCSGSTGPTPAVLGLKLCLAVQSGMGARCHPDSRASRGHGS